MADFKKVAIVHDWLYGGGAERVVLELHRMFPEAPIYTSYCSDEWRAKLDGKVVTGYLQHWPFSKLRKILAALRLEHWWFEHLDFSGYDLVISSSGNGEAKAIRVPESTTHLCYCHTPTHFYWRHYQQYLDKPGMGPLNPFARIGLRMLVSPLRKFDLKTAQNPHYMIANSTHIQSDIKRFYNRDATVIFPPIDVERFAADDAVERRGFVTVGRQVPQKHTELIVEACSKSQLPLTVIGRGPEHAHLVNIAGPTIKFITGAEASDEVIRHELASAQAFIFAALDDFGIAPIEAMASGTPVIAYQAGGALDYVKPGQTGAFFAEQTADSLVAALQTFDVTAYDHQAIQQFAQQFSAANFQSKLRKLLADIA